MIVYVVFGGMLATTWVRIIKAVLLMSGSYFCRSWYEAFRVQLSRLFRRDSQVTWTSADGTVITRDFFQPGLFFKPPWGAIDLISLGLALIFGTAGLPHILVRFYTVPDAGTARHSVVWAMVIIGAFYILTTFLGFGAATILTPDKYQYRKHERAALARHLVAKFSSPLSARWPLPRFSRSSRA